MMTPIYLNPPPTPNSFPLADELKEEHDHHHHHHHHQHLKLFITPHHIDHGSSCSSTFFNTTQDQRGSSPSDHHQSQQHEHKVYNNFWHVESSDHQVLPSSSIDPTTGDSFNGLNSSIVSKPENGEDDDSNYNNTRNGLTVKWMSSKMRLMRKMMTSNCAATEKEVRVDEQQKYQDHHHHHHHQQQQQQQHSSSSTQINYFENGNNGIIRVCSNCNTTKTPLWRGGPCGPKSLCNACGIRQRKARRAMEAAAAAANGTVLDTATDTSSSSSTKSNYKVINKEKKSRTNYYVAQYKKQCKALQDQDQDQDQEGLCTNNNDEQSTNKKLCFEDFALNLLSKNSGFQGVFPQDEEEGAILLMALSCDLV